MDATTTETKAVELTAEEIAMLLKLLGNVPGRTLDYMRLVVGLADKLEQARAAQ